MLHLDEGLSRSLDACIGFVGPCISSEPVRISQNAKHLVPLEARRLELCKADSSGWIIEAPWVAKLEVEESYFTQLVEHTNRSLDMVSHGAWLMSQHVSAAEWPSELFFLEHS